MPKTVRVGPLALLLTLALAGCHKETPPPKETPAVVSPPATDISKIVAPVTNLAVLPPLPNVATLTNQLPTVPPVPPMPRVPPVPPMPTPPVPAVPPVPPVPGP